LLLVCTIAVIVGTLVLQGLSLPWVIRRLGIVMDHRAVDERERADAHARAGQAINDRVDSMCEDGQLSDRQAELMRKWAALRDWRNWDDDDKSREFGRRLGVLSDWRRSLLGIERSVIVGMRNDGDLSEDVLREMQHDLDLEEALLERRSVAVDGHLDELPPGEGAESPDRDDVDGAGAAGAGAADGEAPVDEAATVDDAEVSALLLDEQSADGATVGRTAGRSAE
jgi:CPA1 family monovalent cation:H+ antiporter